MKRFLSLVAVLALVVAFVMPRFTSAHPAATINAEPRFVTLDVLVDSGATPLAAYQVEFTGTLNGNAAGVKLVGIEGASAAKGMPFSEPPGYDPAALAGNRVILADFSTAAPDALPRGVTRVARLHLMIEPTAGNNTAPAYAVTLVAASDTLGNRITATASIAEGTAP